MVFGVIIAFLAVAGIFALLVFSGSIAGPLQREFTVVGVSQQEEVPAPCLPAVDGQPDGALPLAYSDVRVTPVNASDKQGVAGAFETELSSRGFTILGTGTIAGAENLEDSELRFGKKGIVAAYTLAAQFPSIRLVLDDRKGDAVDLLIGEEYDTPIEVEDVEVAADKPLKNVDGCLPAKEITPKERLLSDEKQEAKQEDEGSQEAGPTEG